MLALSDSFRYSSKEIRIKLCQFGFGLLAAFISTVLFPSTTASAQGQVSKNTVTSSTRKNEKAEETRSGFKSIDSEKKDLQTPNRLASIVEPANEQKTSSDKIGVDSIDIDPTKVSYDLGETEVFHATAYCLKGRTATGATARPGMIAADPRVLPIGTVVHMRSGSYTGTYTVMDTGGSIKGRRIDVYVPTHREAVAFGRQKVTVRIIAKTDENGIRHWEFAPPEQKAKRGRLRRVTTTVLGLNPVALRNQLEKRFIENSITDEEYQVADSNISHYEDQLYLRAAKFMVEDEQLLQNADYSPNGLTYGAFHKKDLTDTFYERIQLEADRIRELISKVDYEEKKQQITQEEKQIILEKYLNPADIVNYYDKVSHLSTQLPVIVKVEKKSLFDILLPWASIIVALIAIALPFYIAYRKDRRENWQLGLQEREMEFKGIQAQETYEKTAFLLQMKELQVKEMKLKIAQLEQQLLPNEANLIVIRE